jgi:hypothetical protein
MTIWKLSWLGAVHKLRRQDFAHYWPHHALLAEGGVGGCQKKRISGCMLHTMKYMCQNTCLKTWAESGNIQNNVF